MYKIPGNSLTLEQPSMSIDVSKFLHANKSCFLKYYRLILFDFYSFKLVDTLRVFTNKSQKVQSNTTSESTIYWHVKI